MIKETTGLDLVALINDTMSTKQGNKELVQAVSQSNGSPQPTTERIE